MKHLGISSLNGIVPMSGKTVFATPRRMNPLSQLVQVEAQWRPQAVKQVDSTWKFLGDNKEAHNREEDGHTVQAAHFLFTRPATPSMLCGKFLSSPQPVFASGYPTLFILTLMRKLEPLAMDTSLLPSKTTLIVPHLSTVIIFPIPQSALFLCLTLSPSLNIAICFVSRGIGLNSPNTIRLNVIKSPFVFKKSK
jgi:hypothetical protein